MITWTGIYLINVAHGHGGEVDVVQALGGRLDRGLDAGLNVLGGVVHDEDGAQDVQAQEGGQPQPRLQEVRRFGYVCPSVKSGTLGKSLKPLPKADPLSFNQLGSSHFMLSVFSSF